MSAILVSCDLTMSLTRLFLHLETNQLRIAYMPAAGWLYFYVSLREVRRILPFFFFNDTATPEIYPLSLHGALPIFPIDDSLAAAGTSANAIFSISARDKAGNAATLAGDPKEVIQIDRDAPSITGLTYTPARRDR